MGSPTGKNNNNGSDYGYQFGMPQQNPGMPQPGGPIGAIGGGGGGFQPQPGSPIGAIGGGGGGFQPQPGGGFQPQPGGPIGAIGGGGGGFKQPGQYPGILEAGGAPQQAVMPYPGQGGPGTQIQPPPAQGAFQGLAQGTMGDMRGHVQSGDMGRAKQAYEAGGGTWDKSIHQRLKNKWG